VPVKIVVHTQLSPRIVEIRPPTTDITLQEFYDAMKQWEQEPAAHSFDPLVIGEGKAVLSATKQVGVTAIGQNIRAMFTGRTTPLEIGGTCTTADTRGLTLVAGGGDFVNNGVYPGCTVINTTTFGMAAIHEVVGPGELRSFKLSGGSRDDWQIGDTYRIYENQRCEISDGNFVAIDDVGADLDPVLPSPGIQVLRSGDVSAALISGSGGATASAVADAVWDHTSALRLLGLSHENSFLDNTLYDANDPPQLTGARLRCFDSQANADAAEDGDDYSTGLIATYQIDAAFEAPGKMRDYRMTLVP